MKPNRFRGRRFLPEWGAMTLAASTTGTNVSPDAPTTRPQPTRTSLWQLTLTILRRAYNRPHFICEGKGHGQASWANQTGAAFVAPVESVTVPVRCSLFGSNVRS